MDVDSDNYGSRQRFVPIKRGKTLPLPLNKKPRTEMMTSTVRQCEVRRELLDRRYFSFTYAGRSGWEFFGCFEFEPGIFVLNLMDSSEAKFE